MNRSLSPLILLCLVVLVAGCTGPSASQRRPPVPRGGGPGSGTVVWLADPIADTATNDLRQNLADAFQRAYPSIKIKLETGPANTDSLRSLLVGQLSAGAAAPDVYDGDVIWPYELARDGLALPLSRYLPASFWRAFGSAGDPGGGASMVRAMTYGGAVYGVPEFIDEGFLFYRKDLLRRAGLAPPRTWEQLVADAKVLGRDGLPDQFVWQGNNYEGLTCDWYEFMADAFGGLPAGARPATDAADLDSPQALKALTFLRGLIDDGISPRNVDTFEETDADSAFDNGNAAFLRGWDSSYSNALSTNSKIPDPAGNVGVETLPTFQGEPGPGWSVLGGWGLFVNPHTRNLPADLTFVRWMAGHEAQWILATEYSEIPTIAAVRDDPAVIAGSPVLRAAAGTRMVLRPATAPGYQSITDAIHVNVNAALPSSSSAGITPCTALSRAARAIDPKAAGTSRCQGASSGQG